jgi:hypothetical protein
MLVAQGLGEYGALASGGASRFREVLDNIEYTVGGWEPSTWLLLSVGLVAVWFLFFRK